MIYLIHGNLQTPAVWNDLAVFLLKHNLDVRAVAVDAVMPLHENVGSPHAHANALADWAQAFCGKIRHDREPRILVGYSLGGRLALHALLQDPDLWHRAIVCGAHPGSADDQQRKTWLANDLSWAERFRSEPWEKLMADWDAQSVFGGVPNPCSPQEGDFKRELLARQFIAFSKGNQQDLMPHLREVNGPPVIYVSGQKDEAYTRMGQKLATSCRQVSHQIIPGAAHRVPWENPTAFAQLVAEAASQ